jgi:hypothetical protein
MKIRSKSLLAIATVLAAGLSAACASEAARAKDTSATRASDSSGQVVVQDEVWYPWRYEPMAWEQEAWANYQQREEKASARELRKTESWLNFAASHALPESQKALERAATDVNSVASDLEKGEVVKADRLGYALARADHALAEWHYFKARDDVGRLEEADAAVHLRTAARYLQHAATAADNAYGPETTSFFEDMDKYGDVTDEGVTVESNDVATHLDALKLELDKMAKTLDAAANKDPAA